MAERGRTGGARRHDTRALRKIDTRDFHLATRSTVRDVNRQIVLNLVRELEPISRAALARRMAVARGAVTEIVRELIAAGAIYEAPATPAVHGPGRPPTMLRLRTRDQAAIAVDIRPGRTVVALMDFAGRALARESFATSASPDDVIAELGPRLQRMLAPPGPPHRAACHGIGVVVPGMVDRTTGCVLYAPRLGWRDVELEGRLAAQVAVPVQIESAPIACALARLWLAGDDRPDATSFAYVSISDGVGVGLVAQGDVLRGDSQTAGEFGHISLDPRGPVCACGRRGCWEAFVCNAATVDRYRARIGNSAEGTVTVEEVARRGLAGERAAIVTLEETGTHVGRGLAAVVNAFNPGRIFVGGEITAAWPVLRAPIQHALAAGALTSTAQRTVVLPDGSPAEYRLLGAVALVAAPSYAALAVG